MRQERWSRDLDRLRLLVLQRHDLPPPGLGVLVVSFVFVLKIVLYMPGRQQASPGTLPGIVGLTAMDQSDYGKHRPDLRKLQILVELREAANLTQDQVGASLGLEGAKRRDSVRAWETGASCPALKRRPDFIVYLLDGLRLRNDPQRFLQVWDDIMVGEWGWRPLTEDEWRKNLPGRKPPDGATEWRPSRYQVVERSAPPAVSGAGPPSPELPPPPPFVGRDRVLAQLDAALVQALNGQGRVLTVVGEAGSGKTALCDAFARQALETHGDLLFAAGRCDAQTGCGDPYLPFCEILATLTGQAPRVAASGRLELEQWRRVDADLPFILDRLTTVGHNLVGTLLAVDPFSGQAADPSVSSRFQGLFAQAEQTRANLSQGRLLQQYTDFLRAVSVKRPLLLFVDDAQWIDAASLDLLFHLGRDLEDSRILLVVAYRPDDLALGRDGCRHPLEPVVNELQRRYGESRIDLDRAMQTEGEAFVEAFLDTERNRLDAAFREALYHRTGGHPLFVIELLRSMQAHGDLVQDAEGYWVESSRLDWDALPARVEAVIQEHIDRLAPDLREVLEIASVEGEVFTAQVVAHVRGIAERQLLRRLSQDLQKRHHLVQEQGEIALGNTHLSRYQFAHALYQQYLYDRLGQAERRLLNGDVATALLELYGPNADEVALQLAHHYQEAGEEQKAIPYLLRAGDQARALYADAEAIENYRQALVILRKQGDDELVGRTLMKLGLAYQVAFDYAHAQEAFSEGFARWQRSSAGPSLPDRSIAQRLVVSWTEPAVLDPGLNYEMDASAVIDQLFSGLVARGEELEMVPDVARSWEVREGGRQYVFHLAPSVYWSDGAPLTAHDFEFAWKRALCPATGSSTAAMLYDVAGARAYHQGVTTDPCTVGVSAADPFTLVVDLEAPTSYFLQLLTSNVCYPVPRHVLEANGRGWALGSTLVSNGAFRLINWQPGVCMRMARNGRYHGSFRGNIQELDLYFAPDAPSAYANANLDVLNLASQPNSVLQSAQRHPVGTYLTGPALSTTLLVINPGWGPFVDARVRRALVLAINRSTLAGRVLGGRFFPATGGFVPPGMPGHVPGVALPHDPDQARWLLAQAGYPRGRGLDVIEAVQPVKDVIEGQTEYLQHEWQEQLGVPVRWQTVEFESFLARMAAGHMPSLYVSRYTADYPDPDDFMRAVLWLRGIVGPNPACDALVVKARQVTEQSERMELYRRAEEILAGEAMVVPLAYARIHLLLQPWIRRYPTSPVKWWFWKDVIIDEH
jgi:ABC-type oligopeptide transport system substrate-binding subunit